MAPPPPATTLSKETVTLIFWNLPPQTECAVSVVYSFQLIFTQTSQKCYKRTAISYSVECMQSFSSMQWIYTVYTV